MGRSIRAGSKDFFFRGAAFTLEKAAGYSARGVASFLIIDGQREKVLALLGSFRADDGNQNYGVVHGDHYCAVRLPCYFTGFQC